MSLISLALASSSALANGDSHKTPSGIPPVEVRIEMGEFFFSPSLLNLVGGLPYIFRFVNIGKVAHEFDSPALVAISESEKVEVVSPGGKVIAQIYGVPDEIILARAPKPYGTLPRDIRHRRVLFVTYPATVKRA